MPSRRLYDQLLYEGDEEAEKADVEDDDEEAHTAGDCLCNAPVLRPIDAVVDC